MAGNSYVSHANKLVVFWSPKCACTSVVKWFLHIEKLEDKSRVRDWLVERGYLYNYRQARHLVDDLGYRSVHFTRNPYSRAVSAYLNKFYIYQNKELVQFGQLERFAQEFVRDFNKANNLDPNVFHGFSFNEYLLHVKKMMDRRKVINHHWDTQLARDVDFRVTPDFIVKQESFAVDLEKVNDYLKIESYIPNKKNKTEYPPGFNVDLSDKSEINSLRLIEDKIILNRSNLLSESTKNNIAQIYQEDFSFFQYEA